MLKKYACWNMLAWLLLPCLQSAEASVLVGSAKPNSGVRLVVESETLSGFLGYLHQHYGVAVRLPASLKDHPVAADVSADSLDGAIARVLRPFSAAMVRDGHGRLKAIEVFAATADVAAAPEANAGVVEAEALLADDPLDADAQADMETAAGDDAEAALDQPIAPDEGDVFVTEDEADPEEEDVAADSSERLSSQEYAQAIRRHNRLRVQARQQPYLAWQRLSRARSAMMAGHPAPFSGMRSWPQAGAGFGREHGFGANR